MREKKVNARILLYKRRKVHSPRGLDHPPKHLLKHQQQNNQQQQQQQHTQRHRKGARWNRSRKETKQSC